MKVERILQYTAALFMCLVISTCTLFTGDDTMDPAGTVDTPSISISSGTYDTTQTVSVTTTTAGATIKYTTDDTDPITSTAFGIGTVGSETAAITVDRTLTLKAYAYKSGMVDSGIATETYVISSAPTIGPDYTVISSVYPINVFPASPMQGSFRITNSSVAGTADITWQVLISSDNLPDAGDKEIGTGIQAALAVGKTSGVITYSGSWPGSPTGYYLITILTSSDEIVTGNNTVVSGLIPLAATGRFVAVGDAGHVVYSDDGGATWAASVDIDLGSANLRGIALDSDTGRLVAVGSSPQAVAFYSDDGGVNWVPSTIPISDPLQEITWGKHSTGGGRFVAIANGKIIYWSDPNASWTVATTAVRNYADIAFGSDTFAVVTYQFDIADYSINGAADWTSTTSGLIGQGAFVYGITFAGTRFVAAGKFTGNGFERFYYSPDGISWTRPPDPVGVAIGSMSALAYDGSEFVIAVGDGGRIWYTSNEGSTWALAAGATLPDSDLRGVVFGDGIWVTVGTAAAGNIWRTINVAGPWEGIAESANTLYDVVYIP